MINFKLPIIMQQTVINLDFISFKDSTCIRSTFIFAIQPFERIISATFAYIFTVIITIVVIIIIVIIIIIIIIIIIGIIIDPIN